MFYFLCYCRIVIECRTQENLRGRIARITYQEKYNQDKTKYNHATHYSYDIHGNIKTLVQDNPSLAPLGQQYKHLHYQYDLVSGNIKQLTYQDSSPDQYSQHYTYDSANRIDTLYSSTDGLNLDPEATYQYYPHGALARTEIGDGIQGIDYAYTLQGWIKSINSDQLDPNKDMGGDGKTGSPNSTVQKDAYGYTLQYNNHDYQSITTAQGQTEPFLEAIRTGNSQDLYNGNIARMATTLTPKFAGEDETTNSTHVRDFRYDVLNRIKTSSTVPVPVETVHAPSLLQESTYATTYDYDANGNLQHLTRNDQNGNPMDNLTYHYETDANGNYKNNRLLHVNDAAQSNQTTDLKDQGNYVQNLTPTHNYSYDKIGNLVADKSEEIEEISWTMQGKVKRITRLPNSDKPDLVFNYDGLGNRVSKTVIPKNSVNSEDSITTYYVRDAQGNVLATYEKTKYKNGDEKFYLKEQYLYGSSRIGMKVSNQLLASNINGSVEIKEYDGYFTKTVGNKRYELTNHLGNVLAVVSDKKLPDNEPDVISVSDYYPFGMQMPGRNFSPAEYRFGFGSHEKDFEVNSGWYSFGDYGYDARILQRTSPDPKWKKYPEQSPYLVFNGNPILYNDPLGQSGEVSINKQSKTITINANLIFHGEAANSTLAKETAADIQNLWNGAQGKVTIEGVEYSVQFNITSEYRDTDGFMNSTKFFFEKGLNTDVKNNFIEVKNKVDGGVSNMKLGGNEAVFQLDNINGRGTTTEAHEFGHGLGLWPGTKDAHPENLDLRGKGQPGIMYPRGTLVDPEYQYNSQAKAGAKGGTLNPNTRKVMQEDIDALGLDKLEYNNEGKSNLGNSTSHW